MRSFVGLGALGALLGLLIVAPSAMAVASAANAGLTSVTSSQQSYIQTRFAEAQKDIAAGLSAQQVYQSSLSEYGDGSLLAAWAEYTGKKITAGTNTSEPYAQTLSAGYPSGCWGHQNDIQDFNFAGIANIGWMRISVYDATNQGFCWKNNTTLYDYGSTSTDTEDQGSITGFCWDNVSAKIDHWYSYPSWRQAGVHGTIGFWLGPLGCPGAVRGVFTGYGRTNKGPGTPEFSAWVDHYCDDQSQLCLS